MNNSIEIPYALMPVLSKSDRQIKLFGFYYHLRQNFSFPLKSFGTSDIKILTQITGWSLKTIYNRLALFKTEKIMTVKNGEFNILSQDLFYSKLAPGFSQKPFFLIKYSPKIFEEKIKALPLYLNILQQQFKIETRIKHYLGEKYSPERSTEIKLKQLELLKSKPYCNHEIKTVPVLTLQRAAKLLNRKSSTSAFILLKSLSKSGLITTHKMPKKQMRTSKGLRRQVLEEPPAIIFFNDM
jgi:hypothetical protein